MKPYFEKQTQLLLKILEVAISDTSYALKGGTAINFFHMNMPRLSVDIDLAYIKINSREEFLAENELFFNKLKAEITKRYGYNVRLVQTKDLLSKQVIVSDNEAEIKIEANLVLRGTVYPSVILNSCEKIEQDYGLKLKTNTLSFEDLFAGKFCAALDRQHPRDLFDVMMFFKEKTITESLKKAFIVYLISGNRPISELINPNRLNHRIPFENEFVGMTDVIVSYEELENARERLIQELNRALEKEDRAFLLSFKAGNPNWDLLGIEHIKHMPAIKWKLMNIQKMTPEKHREMLRKLEEKLA
jgi:predicted nucleotidyltransferase component of viral defense system